MINYSKIAKKIEDILKDRIKAEGLIDSGALLRSIKVTYNDSGQFFIEAEDYFKYLDEKYNLSAPILDSNEISNIIADAIIEEIEKNI